MNNVAKKIAFYASLAAVIRDERFIESSAQAVVDLYNEISEELTVSDLTLDFLRTTHAELHDEYLELSDETIELGEHAFQDLASHMRSPKARQAFQDIGGYDEALFICPKKIRLLTDDPEGIQGMAVVTLVVSSPSEFEKMLRKPGHSGAHVCYVGSFEQTYSKT